MNNTQQNTLARINEIFNKGNSCVILIPPNPSIDAIAASTTLYLALTKIGKNASIAASSRIQSDLTGADKIKNQFVTGGDSLMISFPYSDGAIDKVDYNIQGESFNLIVSPRPGANKLDPSRVNFSYTGGIVDFIITIDAPTLNSLGTIYTENQSHFTGHDILNIDRHLTNAYFGTVNLVNKTISSVSELVLSILQNHKVEIDRDMATNLYAGIAASTNNFTSYSVNADTFENIASLLRSGAIKKIVKKPTSVTPTIPKISPMPLRPQVTNYQAPTKPIESQADKPLEKVEKETKVEGPSSAQEWLKPKIFKDGGLI